MIDDDIFNNFTHVFTPDQLTKIMASFLCEIPERVQHCLDAKKNQNFDRLKVEAHTLKSLALTLGALSLSNYAKKIETASADKNSSLIAELLPKLVIQSQEDIKILQKKSGL